MTIPELWMRQFGRLEFVTSRTNKREKFQTRNGMKEKVAKVLETTKAAVEMVVKELERGSLTEAQTRIPSGLSQARAGSANHLLDWKLREPDLQFSAGYVRDHTMLEFVHSVKELSKYLKFMKLQLLGMWRAAYPGSMQH